MQRKSHHLQRCDSETAFKGHLQTDLDDWLFIGLGLSHKPSEVYFYYVSAMRGTDVVATLTVAKPRKDFKNERQACQFAKMKAELRLSVLLAAAAVLLLATGCQTVMLRSDQYAGGSVYAPSKPSNVQILHAMPRRSYVRLGQVTAEPSSPDTRWQKIEAALRSAAAKMGADAVIVTSDSTRITGSIVTDLWFAPAVQPMVSRIVVGEAIKYLPK